ncbi:MAG: 4-alpha-glucanotransferase [Desulfobulbaceae bacterium]|nr:MAG: 4-alpha-glucanotransferase [Desulfobulbaceae bacterium]
MPTVDRCTAILLHISSLPGRYGIGDLGAGFAFVDFLVKAGVRVWQFLPTCPTSGAFCHSPYMGYSACAGNPLFISPDMMVDSGFIGAADSKVLEPSSEYSVDFDYAAAVRQPLFSKAYRRLSPEKRRLFEDFCRREHAWLDDFALFAVMRERFDQAAWNNWPLALVRRDADELAAFQRQNRQDVEFHKFCQYLFSEQWHRLQDYARQQGILLFGDIPIYVSHDSSDVWANQPCFDLDRGSGLPRHVAGVPPDYFSATGQRWGNPLYLWRHKGQVNKALYTWWRQRFKVLAGMLDLVRIDHFRAFESYWQIPAREKTAVKGVWQKGPGTFFFQEMTEALAHLQIVAEDLGMITPEVEKLRDELGFPGMKILQFAFDSDADNIYLPHNISDPNCLIYTGTHDNDTSVGWYFDTEVPERSKERLRRYANSDGRAIHHDFMRLALSSTARMAVLPMQDILGFGTDCRMNRPATVEGNWLWRCAPRYLNDDVAMFVRQENEFYGRLFFQESDTEDT